MAYWWVNQKQTYKHEVPGGYMWSPKANANGARSPYYDFMTQVQPLDIVFSYADGLLKAVGVATSSAFSTPKPRIFGAVGNYWNDDGWQVNVDFKEVANPISPKSHFEELRQYMPATHSPLNSQGAGNQAYLFSIGNALGEILLALTRAQVPTVETSRIEDLEVVPEEQEVILDASLPETMRVALVKARRGQGTFRNRVQTVEGRCRVTGVVSETLLIASHIKPWSKADNQERLDGNNGLFLSPHVDKLFDTGLISFEQSGKMLVSRALDEEVLEKWSIDPLATYGRFNRSQAYFLEYHNEQVFVS